MGAVANLRARPWALPAPKKPPRPPSASCHLPWPVIVPAPRPLPLPPELIPDLPRRPLPAEARRGPGPSPPAVPRTPARAPQPPLLRASVSPAGRRVTARVRRLRRGLDTGFPAPPGRTAVRLPVARAAGSAARDLGTQPPGPPRPDERRRGAGRCAGPAARGPSRPQPAEAGHRRAGGARSHLAAQREAALPRAPFPDCLATRLPRGPARSVAMGTRFFRARNRCAFFGLFSPSSAQPRGTCTFPNRDPAVPALSPRARPTAGSRCPEPVSRGRGGPSLSPDGQAGPPGSPGHERTASVSPLFPGWAPGLVPPCLAGPTGRGSGRQAHASPGWKMGHAGMI